jgi:hypothetical protein
MNISQGYLLANIYHSTINNSQVIESLMITCTSAEEWIETVAYIHGGVLLSHSEEQIMSFAGIWLELELIMLSQTQKDKYHAFSHCGI